jgi:predicted PurR-regulated permease PerM
MIKNAFFFSLLLAASLAFLAMMMPFFQPILWAVTLAVLFQPVHERLVQHSPQHQNRSALLTLLLILLAVIAPSLFIFTAVASESLGLYEAISSGKIDVSYFIYWLQEKLPVINTITEQLGFNLEELKANISSSVLSSGQWFAAHLFTFGQNTMRFTLFFFLMLYLLFFFLRDGKQLVNTIVTVLPIGDDNERYLMNKFAEVSKATIKGTLAVGMVQGAIGGITFALLGIQSALLWGVAMAILSVLPAIGSALIWIPAALFLFANGMLIKALILILVGAFIIGSVDNILRPILVGRETKMPDYLILLSTMGGIALMGVSGFVLGPVIAAFFLAVWAMFAREFNADNA